MTEMNTENKLEAMQRANGPLLEVKNLQVDFTTDDGQPVHAVRNSSFSVYPGQWVAIVGESGSGKSTSAMAVLGLLPGTGHVVGGSIKLDGEEISGYKQRDFDKLRGNKMGLVPQDPMSNLNPVWRIGTQVKEALAANNMDIAHEKRSSLSKALADADVELKGNDDETFLGSKELPELLSAAKEALSKIGKTGDDFDKTVAYFESEWVPGSETRWRVADDLIKVGVAEDDAWYIAKKYVIGSTMDDRIAGLLSEAGLPDAATRARQYPHEFSGGMRQRALIAIGLACRPELLIADEPTSALDVTVQKKILDHLQMLTDSLGTAVLFITHDLGLAALLRQTALITLLAQMGSFVPAESARIGMVDKIFTRVGASDNISVGESTFMVEMNEAANILNNLSSRSLVLFDELGRGTSTYDGISIAWAIVEHIHEHPKAKARTLFATHYHELNEMEKSFKRIKNYNVSVKEIDNKVIFLRKLERGGSEHSFGIHVAKMAGMPKSIVKRANDILHQLETDNRQQGIAKPTAEIASGRSGMQLSFFQLDDPVLSQIRDEILNLDVNNLTPLEALNKLNDIKKIVKGK